ncbi:alpha/beta hydrolase [Phytohabitans sp. ZYX-F-186]|uniref:Alpha/beta hydrolase n=1 Tax=Phytohabitans maris TaxID=3071409 RepID=A0ABU0ZHB5_9ACTN|nr:alpha/beta hydrolase [Phytohabitans sp. ZYX-F-186]MDQ7906400.1 alpha/beta hydrolase [Phytohabitans sp. ZYX-F-186]
MTPVVFVHGLWLHHTSWQPWVDLFRESGFDPVAPPWPGEPDTVEQARADPAPMGGFGVGEVVDHYAALIGGLDGKPVVVGHSFGGLIAQVLLGRGLAAAGVAIDPAPIKGVLPLPVSSLRVASIALRNPANRKGTVALTPEQWRYGFTNTRTEAEATELYERCAMPSPGRPLFQAAFANVNPAAATKVDLLKPDRGPLLITAGGQDHTVAESISRYTAKLHRRSPAVTSVKAFPDRDHSLTINSDWREVADYVLAWLKEQGLP